MRTLLLLSVAGLATASNSTCSDTSSKGLYTEEMIALRGQYNPAHSVAACTLKLTCLSSPRTCDRSGGKNVSFASFKGKVSLAINVASF